MKKATTILILMVAWINTSFPQNCSQNSFVLNSQAQVDNFALNYPGCQAIIGSIKIIGADIVNLNGLSQINSIGWTLEIQNTSLINLDGLNNLTYIGVHLEISGNHQLIDLSALQNLVQVDNFVKIHNNHSLPSIEGLQNVNFSFPGAFYITDCPALKDCNISNLCQHLANYRNYIIGNNAGGCKNREAVVASCLLPFDSSQRITCLYDGFEDWDEFDQPVNWSGPIAVINGLINIEKTPALIEGDYSITLRSNLPGSEGLRSSKLERDIEGDNALIDISFTYKCLGTGYCKVNLGQNVIGTMGSNYRNIWNTIAGDSTQYSIVLQNISVNQPFNKFELIELEASPIYTAVSAYGISEFIVDDLLITKKDNASSVQERSEPRVRIYPNPATRELTIESDEQFDRIIIYNAMGQSIDVVQFDSRIDVQNLAKGVYILAFEATNKRVFRRFVKN